MYTDQQLLQYHIKGPCRSSRSSCGVYLCVDCTGKNTWTQCFFRENIVDGHLLILPPLMLNVCGVREQHIKSGYLCASPLALSITIIRWMLLSVIHTSVPSKNCSHFIQKSLNQTRNLAAESRLLNITFACRGEKKKKAVYAVTV